MVRLALIAAFALAVSTVAASAQQGDVTPKKPKAVLQERDEAAAYKAATERIPDGADKYDPWGIVRQAPAETGQKKKK